MILQKRCENWSPECFDMLNGCGKGGNEQVWYAQSLHIALSMRIYVLVYWYKIYNINTNAGEKIKDHNQENFILTENNILMWCCMLAHIIWKLLIACSILPLCGSRIEVKSTYIYHALRCFMLKRCGSILLYLFGICWKKVFYNLEGSENLFFGCVIHNNSHYDGMKAPGNAKTSVTVWCYTNASNVLE